ncbi:SIALI-17 repeat-containing surface protein [Streptococcus salivarius]|jgi:LPXTG-domain-containing protein cell wall anchor protein (fragment)|uniref:SIALI-17 repeat-containing surface protein n=1 Tax=Streptococcus salivarius TaxID=1304 RepID=UPI0015836EA5|nr:SIALI-17 repeat-containing surface protein [Streptococcus salivarius]
MKTSKITTLSAIAIATAFLSGAVVHADETQATSNVYTEVAGKITVTPIQQTEQLTTAVDNAKAAGVTVETGNTVNNLTQDQAVNAMNEKANEINSVVSQHNAEKQAYADAQAKYEADKARYVEDKAAYEKNMAEAEANTKKEGNLSEVAEQGLVYNNASEPNATHEVVKGNMVDEKEVQDAAKAAEVGDKDYLVNTVLNPDSEFINGGTYVVLKAGETTTVRYEGLENSTYNGQKIAAVEYDYTPDVDTYAILYNDPTITIGLMNFSKAIDVATNVRFYDANKQLITLTKDALFGFNSLNRGKGELYDDKIEYVSNEAGFITINGSTIVNHEGNKAYADSSNDEGVIGEWDNFDSPNFYKGGIVGLTKDGKMSFHFGNDGRVWQWFAINSTIPVSTLPVKPVEPVAPTIEEPAAPTVKVDKYENISATPVETPTDETPEFNGGIVPLDPPTVEIPEFQGGIPGIPEVHEKPEFNGDIPGIPEVHEKPEFDGGVVPLDPPVVEIPELIIDIPEEPTKPTPEKPNTPKEVPNKPVDAPKEKVAQSATVSYKLDSEPKEGVNTPVYGGTLPVTGEKEGIASTLGLVVIAAGITALTLGFKKRNEGEEE